MFSKPIWFFFFSEKESWLINWFAITCYFNMQHFKGSSNLTGKMILRHFCARPSFGRVWSGMIQLRCAVSLLMFYMPSFFLFPKRQVSYDAFPPAFLRWHWKMCSGAWECVSLSQTLTRENNSTMVLSVGCNHCFCNLSSDFSLIIYSGILLDNIRFAFA